MFISLAIPARTARQLFSSSLEIIKQQAGLFPRRNRQTISIHTSSGSRPMGKKKTHEYNDFLDGEKLRDNANIRTSLQSIPQSQAQDMKDRGKPKKGPKRPQLTHFLCLPLINEASRPQLENGLVKLREEFEESGVVPLKAVRPVGTLHLTLGVMRLEDEDELGKATQYLQELDLERILRDVTARVVAENAAENGTVSENLNASALPDLHALSVDLVGLVPMQKPASTSILYAEPRDASARLLPFGEALKRKFTLGGFVVEDRRSLRLHATIINTIYAKPKGGRRREREVIQRDGREQHAATDDDDGGNGGDAASIAGSVEDIEEQTSAPPDASTAETHVAAARAFDGSDGHGPNAKSWMRFDARDLIDRYKDFLWAGAVRIDRIQICKMGAKKMVDAAGHVVGEEYQVVAEKII